MEKKTQVQISKDLLMALFQYHLAGNEKYLPEIEKALMEKLDSMVKRQLYTTFKTAPTEEEREKARQEYFVAQHSLDFSAGITHIPFIHNV